MARPSKCRCICSMPQVTEFLPRGAVPEAGESVVLQVDELEAIRLLDYRGFTQEQCAARMNISRATVARIYEEGRRKVAQALVDRADYVTEMRKIKHPFDRGVNAREGIEW